jgi:hypothetical protein
MISSSEHGSHQRPGRTLQRTHAQILLKARAANLALEPQLSQALGVCLVSISKRHHADRPDPSRLHGLHHKSIEIGYLATNSNFYKQLRSSMDSNPTLTARIESVYDETPKIVGTRGNEVTI